MVNARAIASLGVLLACAASAGEPSLALRIDGPAHVELDHESAAELSIEVPAGAHGLTLLASAGAVSELPPKGNTHRFRWQAPAQHTPRVAILVARADGEEGPLFGWSTLPVWGVGTAVVSTSPRAQIEVSIGERTFGPAMADAHGQARVPVVVPPGVEFALHGKRKIPLGLPPAPHLFVVLERDRLPADLAGTVRVLAFAVDSKGAPQQDARLQLAVTRGALGPTRPIAPGVSLADWSLQPGSAGPAELSASLAKDRASTVRVSLSRVPGAAHLASLTLSAGAFRAGERGAVLARVAVRDSAGNLIDDPPELHADFGAAGAPVRAGDAFEYALALPSRFDGRRAVQLSVTAHGQPLAQGTLALEPGPIAHLSLRPERPRLVANGRASLKLHVDGVDAEGNRVLLTGLHAEAGHRALPVTLTEDGAELTYLAPLLEDRDQEPISIELGEQHASTTVALEGYRHRFEFGVAGGPSASRGIASAFAALEASTWSTLFDQEFGLLVRAEYLWIDNREESGDQIGSERLLPVVVGPAWRYALGERGFVRGSLGVGAAMVQSSWNALGQPEILERRWVPAAEAWVDFGWRWARSIPFLGAGVAWQGDPKLLTVHGSMVRLELAGGVRFDVL